MSRPLAGLLLLLVSACAVELDDGTATQALTNSPDGDVEVTRHLTYCWLPPTGVVPPDQFADLRADVGAQLRRTWQAQSSAVFDDLGDCTWDNPAALQLRVEGVAWPSPPWDDVVAADYYHWGINFHVPVEWDWSQQIAIRRGSAERTHWLETHAFGVMMGFAEIGCTPPDRGTRWSDDDGDSVMDTCTGKNTDGHLSREDVVGVRRALGWRQPTDYIAEGAAQLGVYRPSSGRWYLDGVPWGTAWGAAYDVPISADFDHDSVSDLATWRPWTGEWSIHPSGGAPDRVIVLGQAGDVPAVGDLRGDGGTDLIVYRPATGMWYVRHEDGSTASFGPYGHPGDVPVLADYDGDGVTDYALWRPSIGTWFIRESSVFEGPNWSPSASIRIESYGQADDVPVPGDYDGDVRADLAVWRPGTGQWNVRRSSAPDLHETLGANGDIPVAGDRWDDGSADLIVFRPSTATWSTKLVYGTTVANAPPEVHGQAGDVPLGRTIAP